MTITQVQNTLIFYAKKRPYFESLVWDSREKYRALKTKINTSKNSLKNPIKFSKTLEKPVNSYKTNVQKIPLN
jgi:hypothetical protein